jgi:short-subunit dehydrogenase
VREPIRLGSAGRPSTAKAQGIVADLADRDHVASVQEQFTKRHADANLLASSAGFFVPKPFLDQTVLTTPTLS